MNPEWNRQLGRHKPIWEDNIKMDPKEVGCDDVEWTQMVQDRVQWRAVVNAVMNLCVP